MVLDETTETQQDNTSGGEGGTTSTEETPTFTQEQVNSMLAKAKSDERADVGRLRKAVDDSTRIAQDAIKRLQAREEAELRREEDEARDDPDRLSAIQIRRQALKIQQDAEEERRKLEADRAELDTQRSTIRNHTAEILAQKYNVAADVLAKYGGDNMEELAKSYGEKTSSGNNRETEPPDSGKTKGGGSGRTPTTAELAASTPFETAEKIKSGEWVVRGWTP